MKQITILLCTICIAVILISCAGKDNSNKSSISNGVDIPVMPNKDKTEDETSKEYSENVFKAVVLELNIEDKTMILQRTSSTNRVKYSYTGGTDITNRYGEIMSAAQLNIGEVVEVEVSSENGKITYVKICEEDFDYPGVTNFKVDKDNKMILVGSEKYIYTDNTVFVNNGKIISPDNLESIDVITLKGYDRQVESVIVTSGHGYVRLDTTEFFLGGYVEIGEKIVESITENMVLAVPVGQYTMTVTKDKTQGSKEIIINGNEEIRVNLIEFQKEAVRLGTLSFKINPSGAKLTIDGVEKDYSKIIDVAFGTHKVVVTAKGYEPYAQMITVEDIFKEYTIELKESESESSSGETTTKDTEKETENKDTTKETVKETSKEVEKTKKEKETTTAQTIDYAGLIGSLFD